MAQQTSPVNRLWLLGVIPIGLAFYLAGRLPEIAAGNPLTYRMSWVPELGVDLSFRIDGLGLLMALLVLGIGGLILVYASGYMAGNPNLYRFYTVLILFMTAMVGVVIADNLILLFIFWELTSITSYLLIGFNHENPVAQRSALQALLVTGGGGLCLLAAFVLLAAAGGSWELSELLQRGDLVRGHAAYLPILLLVFLGAFTKSAQFPFHFWLPNAMAAPTPVSAYLHSATMVKAGVYLLARFNPILGDTAVWGWTLILVGGVTGLLGGWLAWQQTDLKRILAYTTISALGILVFLIGVGGSLGVKAMVLFLLIHSLYKGALFMAAGSIDHETGTRDVDRLGGLWRPMPYTAAAVGLAAFSMAGLPPLLGFVGKEIIYEATLANGLWPVWLTAAAFLMNFFNVAAAAIVLIRPFSGVIPRDLARDSIHAPPRAMWIGPLVLGLLAVLAFIFVESTFISSSLIGSAVSAVYGSAVSVELHPFPTKFTIVPLLSILTILAGFGFFALHGRLKRGARAADRAGARFGPENLYQIGLDGLLSLADQIARRVQDGFLRHYVIYVILTLGVLTGWPLFRALDGFVIQINGTPFLYEVVIVAVVLAATAMVLVVRSLLAAVAALGVVGYGIGLLYLYFDAPDLAMTQFAIETLTVILFVLVLYRLPRFDTLTRPSRRLRDGLIAGLAGGLVTVLVLLVTSVPQSRHVTDFYAANSYLLAKGQNVVNVILVDFRGFDTMVEISVLSVAAIGVYTLVKRAAGKESGRDDRSIPDEGE